MYFWALDFYMDYNIIWFCTALVFVCGIQLLYLSTCRLFNPIMFKGVEIEQKEKKCSMRKQLMQKLKLNNNEIYFEFLHFDLKIKDLSQSEWIIIENYTNKSISSLIKLNIAHMWYMNTELEIYKFTIN